MKIVYLLFLAFCACFNGVSQTSAELIGEVSLDSLVKTVREFSGEDSCVVGGGTVKLLNRVSSSGNDVAADYLIERLDSIVGISVISDVYSAGGRNVYVTQLGSVFPDSIVMICGHYDAVADYCADDNASAVGILLEAARILSKYQFKKTIVYAFWDEEETGLLGSKHHALQSNTNGDKYAAVLNIDMAGYDANDDGVFDIDLNTNPGSVKMKDALIDINSTNSLGLTPEVVQPGTTDSDHGSFWTHGYPAVLLGESWETNDQNNKYHTSEDRINLFNLPYYHKMAKLAIAYMGQTAEAITVSNQTYATQVLNAFVNPTTNDLCVNLSHQSTLNIFNLTGQLLIQRQLTKGQTTINLSDFPQGVYLIKTCSKRHPTALEKKIIIR
jgi:Zn-dependent M28 family amino/carboxypeptidase